MGIWGVPYVHMPIQGEGWAYGGLYIYIIYLPPICPYAHPLPHFRRTLRRK